MNKSLRSKHRSVAVAAAFAAAGAACHARAVFAQASGGEAPLEEVVLRASRVPASAEAYAGSVTIVDAERLERQRAFNKDLISMLANEVPGFGTAPGSISNFDTPLRGRSAVVLIDGVPITPTLRPAGRDIVSIDPSSIARIEVIRGASAIYGNGGAGGVINYVTKRAGDEGVAFGSEIGAGVSLTHSGGSANPAFLQTISARGGRFDFIGSVSYEELSSLFDADGDRIPPSQTGNGGLPDSDLVNLFGKLGYEWGAQRIEASAVHFEIAQDTEFFALPGDVETRQKAVAERGMVDPRAGDEGNDNTVLNFVYTHADVLGSVLELQAYRQEVEQTFDFRPDRFGGSQTLIDSEKAGVRLDLNTPLSFGNIDGTLRWGIDFANDETAQLLTDGRVFVPFLDQDSFAQFAQLELALTSRLDLQAGFRHEDFDVEVEPFTSLNSGADVQGGTLDYGATVYNVGVVVHTTSTIDLFATFSQGFSLSDIGREIRDTAVPGFVQTLRPEPVVLDSHEAGMRFRLEDVSGGFAAFHSESELGARFVEDPDNPGLLIQQRDPEKVYGVEAWANADLAGRWRAGGTLTWMDGEVDTDDDGSFDSYLDSRRIPPVKATGFMEYDATGWLIRLQGLYSGHRDKFDGSLSRGLGEVDSFVTFDVMTALQLGRGELSIGLQNLLNEDYFPVSAQTQNVADRLVEAPSASIFARYRIEY